MNRFKQVVSALGVSMVLALASAQASAGVVYSFSFDTTSGSYLGPVSGQIFGLGNDDSGVSASKVVLVEGPDIAGSEIVFTPEVGRFFANFSTSAGEILSADILGTSDNGAYFLDVCAFVPGDLCPQSVFAAVDGFDPDNGIDGFGSASSIEFAQVPGPAPLGLIVLGLIGLRAGRVAKQLG